MSESLFSAIPSQVIAQDFTTDQIGFKFQNQQLDQIDNAEVCFMGIDLGDGALASNSIRKRLYSYYSLGSFPVCYDVGNLKIDDDFSNQMTSFFDWVGERVKNNTHICVLGGPKWVSTYLYQANSYLNKYSNLGFIDKSFSLSHADSTPLSNDNFLYQICTTKPSYLLQLIELGYQKYLVSPDTLEAFKELHFESCRLGQIRDNIQAIEPYIRNLNGLSISVESLKQSETGEQPNCSPNGLYSEELAQIVRYAGASANLHWIGFFDYDPIYDHYGSCAELIAQSVWCYLEGVSVKQYENPNLEDENYIKYTVHNDEMDVDLLFLKSALTNRWWIEMPAEKSLLGQSYFIPCTRLDYEIALQGDLPERWIHAVQHIGNPN